MEPADCSAVRGVSINFCFSPLPFGEVGGTYHDLPQPPRASGFSPLPFGEVGGTDARCRAMLSVLEVSVPYRSGKWVELLLANHRSGATDVSVPYRSGKWVEPSTNAGKPASSGRFSPLPFGEVGGTRQNNRLIGRFNGFSPLPFGEVGGTTGGAGPGRGQKQVSVPYRSGKWVEPRGSASSRPAAPHVSVPYRSGKWVERGS